jgi:hypothetical protein
MRLTVQPCRQDATARHPVSSRAELTRRREPRRPPRTSRKGHQWILRKARARKGLLGGPFWAFGAAVRAIHHYRQLQSNRRCRRKSRNPKARCCPPAGHRQRPNRQRSRSRRRARPAPHRACSSRLVPLRRSRLGGCGQNSDAGMPGRAAVDHAGGPPRILDHASTMLGSVIRWLS